MHTYMDQTLLTGLSQNRNTDERKQVFIPLLDAGDMEVITRYIAARGGKVTRFYEEIAVLTADFPLASLQSWAPVDCIAAMYDTEGEVRADLNMSVNLIKKYKSFLTPVHIPGTNVYWNGQGVRVAVIDTGIDLGNPCFSGRVKEIRDFAGDGIQDGNGHGSHVAGIIGGSDPEGVYTGMAPGVKFIIAKALRNDGRGTRQSVIESILWAVEKKAHIINLSLGSHGTPRDGTCPECRAVKWAAEQGVHVVVSAGNEGPGPGTTSCPANARGILSVGSCNKQRSLSSFSSRGPSADGRIKPEIIAPGEHIISVRSGGGWRTLSGTSMAAPHTAGMLALLIQMQMCRENRLMHPEEAAEVLAKCAVDMNLDSNRQGAGLINLYRAAKILMNEPVPEISDIHRRKPLEDEEKPDETDDPVFENAPSAPGPATHPEMRQSKEKPSGKIEKRKSKRKHKLFPVFLLLILSGLGYFRGPAVYERVKPFFAQDNNANGERLMDEAVERFKEGHVQKAVGILEGLVSDEPDNHAAWALLGVIFSSESAWEEAIDAWEAAAESAPDSSGYVLNLGKAYAQVGRSKEAIGVWELIEAEGRLREEIETLTAIEKRKMEGRR